ncbi:MAG: hypothetical protein SFX18_05280 [Pirellulales bacterium]|nr:hypothetical protein [Pirellulales bacterium]
MMPTPHTIPVAAAELLRLKVALLERLWELGQRQMELVQNEDFTELFKLLGVKQRLLGGLGSLQRDLAEWQRQDPAQRVWNSATEQEECQASVTRCEELLRLIMAQEQYCETQMISRRDSVASQLLGLEQTLAARQAYDAQETPAGELPAQLDLCADG